MRLKLTLAVLAALAMLAVAGCPRNPGGEETAPPPPAPVTTNTDINIEAPSTTDTTTMPPAADSATPPADSSNPADGSAATPPADGATPPAEDAASKPAQTPAADAAGPVVVFETTKGVIEITIHSDWAPLGAAHFIDLVNAGFYDGAPWFRVLDGFVAQCGVAATPGMNKKFGDQTIKDEPVVKGNVPGTVCFGKTGMPNSRSTHIFINLNDNTGSLDPQGFACFGEVTKGMDVALQLEKVEFGDQGALAAEGGMAAFEKMFPKADYIKKAYVKKWF